MKTRMTELVEFLNKIYVPVDLKTTHSQLMKLLYENDYRKIENADSGKTFSNALVIETKGRGLYETFKGYSISRVDIGRVSKTMVDIAIYSNDGTPVKPIRINKGNIKINLPE